MPAPIVSTSSVKASRSPGRTRPGNRLPLPVVSKNHKSQLMVLESPALVLALLNKNSKSKNRSEENVLVIADAAAYMNSQMTNDDTFILQNGDRKSPPQRYRMKTMKEMKKNLCLKRSLDIMDRFTRSEHPISSKQTQTQNIDPAKILYDRAIEQDIQIYPLKIHHVISHTHNSNSNPRPPGRSQTLPNAISASSSSNQPSSHHRSKPDHLFTNRATSSPLILLSAPLEHLLILQLHRLSHSSFHDKMTPQAVQLQRATSLLNLLNKQRSRDSGGDADVEGEDVSVTISTIRMIATAVMATTWPSPTEGDIQWIHACGPGSLQEVFQRVVDLQAQEALE